LSRQFQPPDSHWMQCILGCQGQGCQGQNGVEVHHATEWQLMAILKTAQKGKVAAVAVLTDD